LLPSSAILRLIGGAAVAGRENLVATPMHLVLDGNGTIVEAGMGATIWSLDSYRPNCQIIDSTKSIGPSPTGSQ